MQVGEIPWDAADPGESAEMVCTGWDRSESDGSSGPTWVEMGRAGRHGLGSGYVRPDTRARGSATWGGKPVSGIVPDRAA